MSIALDHTILEVRDLGTSVAFYRDVVGLVHRGRSGRFEVLLITPDTALDLAESSKQHPRHLAFRMDRDTFDAAFTRMRAAGIPFGDSPSSPANMRGPGRSTGVHGATASVYFSDPDGHLLEILTYEGRDGDRAPDSTA